MRISAGWAREFDNRTTVLQGPVRLYVNNRAGAKEAANNRINRAGSAREAVNNRSNVIGWAREAGNNEKNSIGG